MLTYIKCLASTLCNTQFCCRNLLVAPPQPPSPRRTTALISFFNLEKQLAVSLRLDISSQSGVKLCTLNADVVVCLSRRNRKWRALRSLVHSLERGYTRLRVIELLIKLPNVTFVLHVVLLYLPPCSFHFLETEGGGPQSCSVEKNYKPTLSRRGKFLLKFS